MLYSFARYRKTSVTFVIASMALGTWCFLSWRKPAGPAAPLAEKPQMRADVTAKEPGAGPRAIATAPANRVKVTLQDALDRKWVAAEITGNGRDRLSAKITSVHTAPMLLEIANGMAFNSTTDGSQVVALRGTEAELRPGKDVSLDLASVATRSDNTLGEHTFTPAQAAPPELTDLLSFVQDHPEVSIQAAQTAALTILENPPLTAFAKFPLTSGAARYKTMIFRVDVHDIVGALSLLSEVGAAPEKFTLATNPQLKIEAMIDPLAHAIAMRYYKIDAQSEWTYWKHELLSGAESTRHYALYGIARNYPDIALEMLPTWARKEGLNKIYRASAVQALAETRRPEALTVLRQFEVEFSSQPELMESARKALAQLEADLGTASAAQRKNVAFRFSQSLPTAMGMQLRD